MKFNIKNFARKTKHYVSKHAPEILIVVGVGGTVTGTVMACKATTKLTDVLNDHDIDCEYIKENAENPDELNKEEKKELTKTYAKTATRICKLYLPSVIVEGLSIGTIFASNNILKKRNAALLSSYAILHKQYISYQERVKEKYGEDVHNEMLYGIKKISVTNEVIDEDGKKKKVKEKIDVISSDSLNADPYAYIFDRSNPNWVNNDYFNRNFFESVQEAFTFKLNLTKGNYVFWNDILEYIKADRTLPGQAAGWFNDDGKDGDTYIKLNVRRITRIDEASGEYDDLVYIITPNVEGDITNKVWGEKLLTD